MPVIDLPALAFGANATLPPGVMSQEPFQGALWRELRNLRPHDGYLRVREALEGRQAFLGSRLGPPTWLDDHDQEVVLLSEILQDSGTNSRFLMVTTRELYLWDGFTWYNVTPRYETGTVSINTGTASLSGVSTLWQSYNIRVGQAIELPRDSGDWYELATITGEGTATLTTNYTGTTLAGANYRIRRTFAASAGGVTYPAFATTFNGDIYVAGLLGSGLNTLSGIVIADGGVVKISGGANGFKSTFSGADSDYLVSGHLMTLGGDSVGYFFVPYGLQAMPDGRLVIAVRWSDVATGESGLSRLLFSSHLNLAVWTTSPGGRVDILGNEKVTALRRGTRSLFVHFEDGIQVAAFTGADDPPLDIRPTRATVGAISPKMIQRVNAGPQTAAGDMFVAADHRLYSFAGDTAVPVGRANTALLSAANLDQLSAGFSRFDPYRHEASFAWRTTGRTVEMRVPLDGDAVYEASYPALFYEALQLSTGYDTDDTQVEQIAIYGMTRFDDAAAETDLIFEMRENAEETLPDNTGTTPSAVDPQALSDYLIPPGEAAMQARAVAEIVVWTVFGNKLAVNLIRDGAEIAMTRITPPSGSALKPVRFLAEPPLAALQNQFRLKLDGRWSDIIARVQIFWADAGTGRAT